MNRVFAIKRTVFFKFQFFLAVSPVFAGGIVSPFTFAALEGYQFHRLFLACHILTPKSQKLQFLYTAQA